MEVIGHVHKLLNEQEYDGFKKRDLILTTAEQSPQRLCIEFTGERIKILNSINPNDWVRISINLLGRTWTDKEGKERYLNVFRGWGIKKLNEPHAGFSQKQAEENDDLPF